MAPWLLKPLATVSCANELNVSSATMRNSASVVVVNVPLTALPLLRTSSVPWLTNAAFIMLLRSSNVRPAALVSVPGPLTVEEFSNNVVSAVFRSGVKLALALLSDSVPPPVKPLAL
jgi:hypothetical protein